MVPSSSAVPMDIRAILTLVDNDIMFMYRSSKPSPWLQSWAYGMSGMCSHLKITQSGDMNLMSLYSFNNFMKTMNDIFQNLIPCVDPITKKNMTLGERINTWKSIVQRMSSVLRYKHNVAPRQQVSIVRTATTTTITKPPTTSADIIDVDVDNDK